MAQGVHILVVEDEGIVAHDIRSTLENWGYHVPKIAFTGEEAVNEMKVASPPDLLLMDIRLSGDMDGITAAEKIRRQFDIPVVYLTAYTDENTLSRVKKTEPFGYILKPFKETELYMAIQLALHLHGLDRRLKNRVAKLEQEMKDVKPDSGLRTLAATVVHKLQNSLGIMKTIVLNLKRQNENNSLDDYLNDMEHILFESDAIIDEFLTYSRSRGTFEE